MECQDSEGWFSRVAQSATTLSQDLLSLNSAYETTGGLTALRSAHKTGFQSMNGDVLSERFPKLLSNRHKAIGTLRSSRRAADLVEEAELEDEIVNFLGRPCHVNDGYASSSRSASPLASPQSSGDEVVGAASADSDSVQWLEDTTGGSMQTATAIRAGESSLVRETGAQPGYFSRAREEFEDDSTAKKTNQFDVHVPATSMLSAQKSSPTLVYGTTERSRSKTRLNTQAAQRLELISRHLALTNFSETTTSAPSPLLQRPALETAYSQFCQGENSQEWDDFQPQGPYSLLHDLQARQHADGCQMRSSISSQQIGMQPDIAAYQTLDRIKGVAEERQRNVQKKAKEEKEVDEEEEPMPEFHCPWVGCEQVFAPLFLNLL